MNFKKISLIGSILLSVLFISTMATATTLDLSSLKGKKGQPGSPQYIEIIFGTSSTSCGTPFSTGIKPYNAVFSISAPDYWNITGKYICQIKVYEQNYQKTSILNNIPSSCAKPYQETLTLIKLFGRYNRHIHKLEHLSCKIN